MRWLPLLLVIACASSVRETTLSRANVGSKYARQTGYFAACGAKCIEEETEGGIRHDAILDEITLAKIDPQETCFDVTLRTIERRGSVCCPKPAGKRAALSFRNKHFDYGASKGRLEMVWNLSP